MPELIFKDEVYAIVGAAMEVHRENGFGFSEPVYQECLEIELGFQKTPFEAQPKVKLSYRGIVLSHTYDPDFVCYGGIVVEIKAVAALADEHRAQVLNYLHATGFKLGLLVNFGGHPKLEYERFVLTGSVARE